MAKITLQGNEIHTNGDLPAVGSKAPDFRLVDKDLADKALSDYAGKKKLLDAVAAGKGFVGFHAATDSFRTPPDKVDPYIAMLGGEFVSHGPQQKAKMKLVSPQFPGCEGLGDGFEVGGGVDDVADHTLSVWIRRVELNDRLAGGDAHRRRLAEQADLGGPGVGVHRGHGTGTGAGTGCHGQRQHPETEGQRCHDDRAQPQPGAFQRRLDQPGALPARRSDADRRQIERGQALGDEKNQRDASDVDDLEILADPAPTEIGNRVWEDTDGDGVLDEIENGGALAAWNSCR